MLPARLPLRDDEAQAALARELFDANAGIDALFVSDVVLAELRGCCAAATRRALPGNAMLAWQSRAAVVQAQQLRAG